MVCGGGGGWGKYFEEKDGCGTRGDWKAIWEYGGGWLWEMRRRDGLLGLRGRDNERARREDEREGFEPTSERRKREGDGDDREEETCPPASICASSHLLHINTNASHYVQCSAIPHFNGRTIDGGTPKTIDAAPNAVCSTVCGEGVLALWI
uniref:Uncharacterized protein n=1 Tax=Knipowitschia caucasica TaxID=637954 RepID=A0AAV2KE88_KNICA